MKKTLKIIDNLSSDLALAILKQLAESDEQLAERIAEMALTQLSRVDPEELAIVIYDALDALEVEEVWDRSGATRHGYVDPAEAADQMISEVITPHLEEMKKYRKLGMPAQANRLCMGLLMGLYQFEHDSTNEFKNWASDAAGSYAWVVVDAWQGGSPKQADVKAVKAFVEDELEGWCLHLLQKKSP